MQAEDYYQLLGVNRHAPKETLRHAFRARMLDLHPDLHPNDSLACEQTRRLVEAYKTLSDPKARKSYDTALARPAIPNLDWSYAEPAEPASWARQILILLVVAMVVVFLVWAVRTALADRVPVYRFDVTELWTDTQPQHVALLVEPGVQHGMEWYQTVEFQLRNPNALVTQETTEVYARAIEAAERRGDHESTRFYRSSLWEIHRAQMQGSPFADEADAGHETEPNAAGNVPELGAKPPAGSS